MAPERREMRVKDSEYYKAIFGHRLAQTPHIVMRGADFRSSLNLENVFTFLICEHQCKSASLFLASLFIERWWYLFNTANFDMGGGDKTLMNLTNKEVQNVILDRMGVGCKTEVVVRGFPLRSIHMERTVWLASQEEEVQDVKESFEWWYG